MIAFVPLPIVCAYLLNLSLSVSENSSKSATMEIRMLPVTAAPLKIHTPHAPLTSFQHGDSIDENNSQINNPTVTTSITILTTVG